MKKIVLMAGVALATLGFASCDNSKSCSADSAAVTAQERNVDAVYTGVMPAADCDGVRYTLLLDYDKKDKDGDYTLVETYIQADTTATLGYKDLQSFVSEGDFTVEQKDAKTYLKLVKDAEDSSKGSVDTPLYFVIDSDSAITMANQDLEVSTTPGMNYTLVKTN